MSIVGLDHVQIAAPPGCEPEARPFFGEQLGLTEVEKPLPLRGRGGGVSGGNRIELVAGGEHDGNPARHR